MQEKFSEMTVVSLKQKRKHLKWFKINASEIYLLLQN